MNPTVFIGNSQNMSPIESNSIDLIFAGPPFWNHIKYSEDVRQLGNIDDYQEFLFELKKVWIECARVLKPAGVMCILAHDIYLKAKNNHLQRLLPFHADIIKVVETENVQLQHIMIWDRYLRIRKLRLPVDSRSKSRNRNMIPPRFQYILVFRKSRVNKMRDFISARLVEEYWNPIWSYKTLPTILGSKYLATLLSKIYVSKLTQQFSYSGFFERLKSHLLKNKYLDDQDYPVSDPEEIIEKVIETYSRVGDTVLDPFLGSGTTMKVALNKKRGCIGFELNREAMKTIKKKVGSKMTFIFL